MEEPSRLFKSIKVDDVERSWTTMVSTLLGMSYLVVREAMSAGQRNERSSRRGRSHQVSAQHDHQDADRHQHHSHGNL